MEYLEEEEQRDHVDAQVLQELSEPLAMLDLMAMQVEWDPLDRLALWERLESQEHRVTQGSMELQDQPA